jgi:hypothetical protein
VLSDERGFKGRRVSKQTFVLELRRCRRHILPKHGLTFSVISQQTDGPPLRSTEQVAATILLVPVTFPCCYGVTGDPEHNVGSIQNAGQHWKLAGSRPDEATEQTRPWGLLSP